MGPQIEITHLVLTKEKKLALKSALSIKVSKVVIIDTLPLIVSKPKIYLNLKQFTMNLYLYLFRNWFR